MNLTVEWHDDQDYTITLVCDLTGVAVVQRSDVYLGLRQSIAEAKALHSDAVEAARFAGVLH